MFALLCSIGYLLSTASLHAAQEQNAFSILNQAVGQRYNEYVDKVLTQLSPVIVVDSGYATLFRQGQKEAVYFLSDNYLIFKTVDHAPLGLFVQLNPVLDHTLCAEKLNELEKYTILMSNAQAQLEHYPLSAEQLERQNEILHRCITFAQAVVVSKFCSKKDLYNFCFGLLPFLNANFYDAIAVEIGNLHAIMKRWCQTFSPSEKSQLRVIIIDSHMAESGNRYLQYFHRVLKDNLEHNNIIFSDHLGFGESWDLLAKYQVDGKISIAFFKQYLHMQSDVLSDATKTYLDKAQPSLDDPRAP